MAFQICISQHPFEQRALPLLRSRIMWPGRGQQTGQFPSAKCPDSSIASSGRYGPKMPASGSSPCSSQRSAALQNSAARSSGPVVVRQRNRFDPRYPLLLGTTPLLLDFLSHGYIQRPPSWSGRRFLPSASCPTRSEWRFGLFPVMKCGKCPGTFPTAGTTGMVPTNALVKTVLHRSRTLGRSGVAPFLPRPFPL